MSQMTSKQKQRELRKIEQTYAWIDMLSHDDEFGYRENGYQHNQLVKDLLRFYKYIDFRILFWALDCYEKEVKNTKVVNKND